MTTSDLAHLEHLLQNLQKAQGYLQSVDYEDFILDEEKQDAVIPKIEVCGEAVKRIFSETRNRFPGIPCWAIAGMRDKLIHEITLVLI